MRDTALRLLHDANALDYTSRDVWYGNATQELASRLASLSPRQRRRFERWAMAD